MRLDGYRIIVTGGAGGIGGATVRAYVKEGAKVANIDIRDEEGERVTAEANKMAQGGGEVTYYHCDVSKPDEVFPTFEKIIDGFGGLDVLAHLAAKDDLHKPAEDWVEEDMNEYWSVNLNGTIFVNQAAYKQFQKQQKGNIINFTSDTGFSGAPTQGVYAASKGGCIAWTKSIARTWAQTSNVRCNMVHPQIMTRLYQGNLDKMSPEEQEAFWAMMRGYYHLGGKPGDADRDAGPLMVYLAAEESRFMNGQVIGINGGAEMSR